MHWFQKDTPWSHYDVWPICLSLQQNSRICYLSANQGHHLSKVHLPGLVRFFHPSLRKDVLLINCGLHYFKAAANRYDVELYKQHLRLVTEFVEQHRQELPKALIWLTTPPQHFTANQFGTFEVKPGKAHLQCGPLNGQLPEIQQGGWYNMIASDYVRRMQVLDTWQFAWDLHQVHLLTGDCTHSCLPGWYSVWAWQLALKLR